MNPRERLLAGLVAIVGLTYFGMWFHRTRIAEPRVERENRIDGLRVQLDQRKLELLQHEKAAAQLRAWQAAALSTKRGNNAFASYSDHVRDLLKQAGLPNISVSTKSEMPAGTHYVALPVQVTGPFQPRELARFLDLVQRSAIMQRVSNLTVSPQVSNDRLLHLTASMTLEALAFRDEGNPNPKFEVRRARPDGKRLDDFAWFADKNIFQPTKVETIPRDTPRVAAVAPPPPPPRDDRPRTKVIGCVGEVGAEEIWFATASGKPLAVAVGSELKIAGMTAQVAGFDSAASQVLLRVDGKLGGVRMGSALSTWKELPVAGGDNKT